LQWVVCWNENERQCVVNRSVCETELFTTRLIVSTTVSTVLFVKRHSQFFVSRVAVLVALVSFPGPVGAQEPLAPAAPLSDATAPATSAGPAVLLAAARRAQDFGLPSVAADIYREVRKVPGLASDSLTLALATALLDAGKVVEAEEVLVSIPEPRSAAWRLRAGLAALQLGKRAEAQAQWDATKEPEISEADLPWYRFFTGALWDTAAQRDTTRANDFYTQAENLAATPLARARFQLAAERVRLRWLGKPGDADVRQVRETAQRFQGQREGYEATRNLAVTLDKMGQTKEAVEVLEKTLASLPAQERAVRDEMRFLLGLIGDRGRNGAGRNALMQLLESGHNAQRQQQALQLLAEESGGEPERGHFKAELNKLIAAKPPHPVLENLYFFRAQMALTDKDYVTAEQDATALGQQFPLSPLRVHALVILTQSAWEQGRYRVAAEQARKARGEMVAPGEAAALTPQGSAGAAKPPAVAISPQFRAELGVLEAEARFRATDYRSAADTYAAVLLERPRQLKPERIGDLMFQRVLAEIRAGSGEAATVLDELKSDPAFDVESRWQAEWSLAQALQIQGNVGARKAYARVTALLREPVAEGTGMKTELRAKMAWLHARLAFEIGDFADTIRLVEEQLKTRLEIEAALRNEIASTLMLLKARSEFALGQEAVALETLKRLRAEQPKSEAAIYSYLIESEYYAAQDKIDEARNRLIKLTDSEDPDYKRSPYIPYALYRLALLSERLGREDNLKEANQRIEDLVNTPAALADQTLYFAARMRQGDIFRKLNDFPSAKAAYEELINKFPQRPDVVLAQLALADCYSLQASPDNASSSNSQSDQASLIYEQLRDRVDAPRDVRIEAGYKFGALLVRRGRLDQAARVWWTDVIDPFLKNEAKLTEPDAKRPYWLARTLCELGDLEEKRGNLEQAKAAYRLVLEKRLPFESVARARLQQSGVALGKAGQ
jgi:tetratricopeptide (TPR) repeat protein